MLQLLPLINQPPLRNQRLDGEGASSVAADHLGPALHIGRVEMGHTSLDEVETYTRSADQAKLADTAIAKLEKAEKRTAGVKP
ncbi:hypothetical protein [uncultured Brevundimonas sp.]|uniref:hypothetical protein n=1 Tax=uncultured Brevundimonas sp. TaxID=213418 RepID=UPI0025F53C45|nr:hypothetical protein [uncultured Brevundimonas sp.]